MHIVEGIGDVKGLVRENIPTRKGGDKMAQARGARRVLVHRLRPRHRIARAGLAARGSAEVARQAVGAVRVVRAAALSADRAAALVLSLLAAGLAAAEAATRRPSVRIIRISTTYARTVDYDSHFASADDVKRAIAGYAASCRRWTRTSGDVLRRAARRGARGRDARDLHERSRRQRRRARPVGQVDVLRGERRRAAHCRRARTSRRGRVVATPVSHIDCAPTILGRPASRARVGGRDAARRVAVRRRARRAPARPVISRVSRDRLRRAARYMIRFGRYKYCHYVAYPPQLFDLASRSRGARRRLPAIRASREVVAEGERRLRAALDPEEVDARAKRRQAELLARYGGREAALARGDLGFTPAPGTAAEMN